MQSNSETYGNKFGMSIEQALKKYGSYEDANDIITYYVVGLDGKIVKDAVGKPVIWNP